MCRAFQGEHFTEIECTMAAGLHISSQILSVVARGPELIEATAIWSLLEPSHLLNIHVNGEWLKHDPTKSLVPLHHLDHTFLFKEHLSWTAAKLRSATTSSSDVRAQHVMLVVAPSSISVDVNYWAVKYCSSLWLGFCHTKLIDTGLHSSTLIVSACLDPTQMSWLAALLCICIERQPNVMIGKSPLIPTGLYKCTCWCDWASRPGLVSRCPLV